MAVGMAPAGAFGGLGFCFDHHQVQLAVVHAALGHQAVCKAAHRAGRALEQHGLDAVVVVQVRVGAGDGQLMVVVLVVGQAFRQLALVVVVDVGQIGHAGAVLVVGLPKPRHVHAQDVAHRLAAVAVAAFGDQVVELVGEFVVKGDGEAFHGRMVPWQFDAASRLAQYDDSTLDLKYAGWRTPSTTQQGVQRCHLALRQL